MIEMNKRDLILELRERRFVTPLRGAYSKSKERNAMTFQEIADIFGVSRQRIHQIASNPNWTGITGRPRKYKEIIGNAEL